VSLHWPSPLAALAWLAASAVAEAGTQVATSVTRLLTPGAMHIGSAPEVLAPWTGVCWG
jgi:hypothetical protein